MMHSPEVEMGEIFVLNIFNGNPSLKSGFCGSIVYVILFGILKIGPLELSINVFLFRSEGPQDLALSVCLSHSLLKMNTFI